MRLVKYKLQMVKEDSCNYGGKEYKIKNPWDVYKALLDICKLDKEPEEVLMLICLDTKNKIIGLHEVSRGTISTSYANSREIFKRALLNNASSIIIAHNHPSGDLQPSQEDKNVSNRIFQAGRIMNIPLIDNLIIGNGCYYSFKEKEIL